MEFGDFAALGGGVGLIAYVLWFISKADSRLFGLADRQAAQITALQNRLDKEEALTDDLQDQLNGVEAKLGAYMHGTRVLIQQIRTLGHEPMWHPD